MNTKARICSLVILALAAPAVAAAQNHVTFGDQWWTRTAEEAKFHEYRDVPLGGFLESFYLVQHNERDLAALWGANALQDDQHTGLWLARGARAQLELEYSRQPHRLSEIARTPYTRIAPGTFVLPDSFQAAIERTPALYLPMLRDLLRTAGRTPLSVRTDETSGRLRLRPAQGWALQLNGLQRSRSGLKPYGATFGFSSAIELVEPIEQRTYDGTAVAEYSRGDVRVRALGGVSVFDNTIDALRWDNPRRATDRAAGDGSSTGQLALAPDNRVIRGEVGVGVKLPRRTLFSATVGLSDGRQDQDFLPYTVNTAIPQRALDSLPARSFDGHRTRVAADVRITSRPVKDVVGALRFNRVEEENKSPELTFPYDVTMDGALATGPFHNHVFGNTRQTVALTVDWKPMPTSSIGAVVESRMREHTLREVERDDEFVVGGRFSAALAEMASLEGSFTRGKRKLDEFHEEHYQNDAGAFIEQPDLRRFDVADRTRDEAQAGILFTPMDRVDVSVDYTFRRDDYADSRYGLQEVENNMVVSQATIHALPNVDVNVGYGFERLRQLQASNETNAAAPPTDDVATDWTADVADKNVQVFGGAEWRPIPRRLTVLADYSFNRAQSTYDMGGLNGAARDLPNVFYRHHDVRLEARYRVARTELGLRYGFEQYDVDDFAATDIPLLFVTGTSATALFLGDSSLDYRAHRVALVATRRF